MDDDGVVREVDEVERAYLRACGCTCPEPHVEVTRERSDVCPLLTFTAISFLHDETCHLLLLSRAEFN